jgi:M6 family metalloprotease-like protein
MCKTYLPRLAGLFAAGMLLGALTSHADPSHGDVFRFTEANGERIDVRIWGDEYYRVVESLDGFTLTRDPQTGLTCYADLSSDGRELISTGIPLSARGAAKPNIPAHIRINAQSVRAKVQSELGAQATYRNDALRAAGISAEEDIGFATPTGNVKGLCLLVDFADDPATIPYADIDDYCNEAGYSGFGNNGSVRDYFYDVSDGNLTYTNHVTAYYYRALKSKSYYADASLSASIRGRELVLEALNYLESVVGHDFSVYDSDGDGYIDAINCFYAGDRDSPWSKGLWPHQSSVYGFTADGVASRGYQITNIGTSLALGTFCHENGHMICGFPDLYDYGGESSGVGRHCIMCVSGGANPLEPCAYLKHIAGWTTTIQLTTPASGLVAPADSNTVYKFDHPTKANEFYMIENRQRTGRDSGLPSSGLAIWHIDTYGSNNYEDMTPARHYKVTLVQADGRWDMENRRNSGDSTDLWKAPGYTTCDTYTVPHTGWWAGDNSYLGIYEISASGSSMTFNFDKDYLEISPFAEMFLPSGPPGGSFTPESKAYTLTNQGALSVDWTAQGSEPWLGVAPTSGTLTMGQSVAVVACVQPEADLLGLGAYAASIDIANVNTGNLRAVPAELTVETYASLPFYEDFESGPDLAAYWTASGSGSYFRTQVTTENGPYGGARHLTMDSERGECRNELTLAIDLSTHRDLQLSFYAREFGDEPDGPPGEPFMLHDDFDGVAVSVDGVEWHEIFGLRDLTSAYQKYTVDLDAFIYGNGLLHSPTFKIRFNQFGYGSIPVNGIAIDNVRIWGRLGTTSAANWEQY